MTDSGLHGIVDKYSFILHFIIGGTFTRKALLEVLSYPQVVAGIHLRERWAWILAPVFRRGISAREDGRRGTKDKIWR
jgi:hypothetical protein